MFLCCLPSSSSFFPAPPPDRSLFSGLFSRYLCQFSSSASHRIASALPPRPETSPPVGPDRTEQNRTATNKMSATTLLCAAVPALALFSVWAIRSTTSTTPTTTDKMGSKMTTTTDTSLPATTTAPLTRITMFKIPSPENQQKLVEAYGRLEKEAEKVCMPCPMLLGGGTDSSWTGRETIYPVDAGGGGGRGGRAAGQGVHGGGAPAV